jgi:hypothetical protein
MIGFCARFSDWRWGKGAELPAQGPAGCFYWSTYASPKDHIIFISD